MMYIKLYLYFSVSIDIEHFYNYNKIIHGKAKGGNQNEENQTIFIPGNHDITIYRMQWIHKETRRSV